MSLPNKSSAGDGAPYWYEWSVGLFELIKSLQPENNIEGVTIQHHQFQGWDDVVVRHVDGSHQLIQVKHSQDVQNFTVGSLLEKRRDGRSLIAYLYQSWCSFERDFSATPILFSNRKMGLQGVTVGGIYRPPLKELISWLEREAPKVITATDLKPPEKWNEFWLQFNKELACSDIPTVEEGQRRLRFYRALQFRMGEDDLGQVTSRLVTQLAKVFGVSSDQAVPLLSSIDSKLREWSSGGQEISPDEFYEAFTLPAERTRPDNIPPPVPSPFFPSREEEVETLRLTLLEETASPVVFLTGVPGAGKTAMISKICFKAQNEPFRGPIGLRYFAFKPLSPGSLLSPADSDLFVSADGLWFGLLNELRNSLQGRLAEMQVPIRNSLLNYTNARQHVLRIADMLGTELGRPLVIAVDGVDHAARASRYKPADVKAFFESLPSPDELAEAWPNVRLLIGGQPYDYFPEVYPSWMSGYDSKAVTVQECGKLSDGDIRMLIEDCRDDVDVWDVEATIELLGEHSGRNTLAVVYACEELRNVHDLENLKKRLKERHLQAGLQDYYKSVWDAAVSVVPDHFEPQIALAVSFACLRDPIDSAFLKTAFPEIKVSELTWSAVIDALKPLIIESGSGYAIRHNDLRVFLMDYFSAKRSEVVRRVAGWLCDHFQSDQRCIESAHRNLPILLRVSSRQNDWASIFNAEWVFESASILEDEEETQEACRLALAGVQSLHDWDLLNKVSIGLRCLLQWKYLKDGVDGFLEEVDSTNSYVGQRPCEAAPPPISLWTTRTVEKFCEDFQSLWNSGEAQRAIQSFSNWFGEISLEKIINLPQKENLRMGGGKSYDYLFEFGKVARMANAEHLAEELLDLPSTEKGAFELHSGWLNGSLKIGYLETIDEFSLGVVPRYQALIEDLVFGLAKQPEGEAFHEIAVLVSEVLHKLPNTFGFRFRWVLIETDNEDRYPEVFEQWSTEDLSFEDHLDSETHELDVLPILDLACVTGFMRPGIDPAEVKEVHFPTAYRGQSWEWSLASIMESGGLIGRITDLVRRDQSISTFSSAIRIRVKALIQIIRNPDYHYSAPKFREPAEIALENILRLSAKLPLVEREKLLDICEEEVQGDHWLHLKALVCFLGDGGRCSILRDLAYRLIGPLGTFWTDRGDVTEHEVKDLQDLCERGNCIEIWEKAIVRIKKTRVHHSTHKDYSLEAVNSWLRELSSLPEWDCSEALHEIASINEAFWSGNEYSREITESLGGVAAKLGPSVLGSLLLKEPAPEEGHRSLYRMEGYLVGAIAHRLARGKDSPLTADDAAAWGTLLTSYRRWFQISDDQLLYGLRLHYEQLYRCALGFVILEELEVEGHQAGEFFFEGAG